MNLFATCDNTKMNKARIYAVAKIILQRYRFGTDLQKIKGNETINQLYKSRASP